MHFYVDGALQLECPFREASPNVKIGCRAYLCEARRALSEPVVDPMYVLLHFALSLNISYTHPGGICPGYLSIPTKILLPKVLLLCLFHVLSDANIRMRTKSTGLKLRNLGNDAFSVETPPEHIKLHGIVLAVAKKQLFAHEYTLTSPKSGLDSTHHRRERYIR